MHDWNRAIQNKKGQIDDVHGNLPAPLITNDSPAFFEIILLTIIQIAPFLLSELFDTLPWPNIQHITLRLHNQIDEEGLYSAEKRALIKVARNSPAALRPE